MKNCMNLTLHDPLIINEYYLLSLVSKKSYNYAINYMEGLIKYPHNIPLKPGDVLFFGKDKCSITVMHKLPEVAPYEITDYSLNIECMYCKTENKPMVGYICFFSKDYKFRNYAYNDLNMKLAENNKKYSWHESISCTREGCQCKELEQLKLDLVKKYGLNHFYVTKYTYICSDCGITCFHSITCNLKLPIKHCLIRSDGIVLPIADNIYIPNFIAKNLYMTEECALAMGYATITNYKYIRKNKNSSPIQDNMIDYIIEKNTMNDLNSERKLFI